MSTAAPPANDVERIWLASRPRAGSGTGGADRRQPGPGMSDVLLALLSGPAHGSEVARRAGRHQSTVVAVWLPRLCERGFVQASDPVEGLGHQGGGRPARIWTLTERGRELAEALEVTR